MLNGDEFLDSVKDEINHLVVELNQTSERNIGIIEERISRLQKLVEVADRKIVLLGKESEKVKLGSEVYDNLRRAAPMAPAYAKAPDAPAPATDDGRTGEVLELSRQGFDKKLIAARTGTSLGEVELIISLAQGKE